MPLDRTGNRPSRPRRKHPDEPFVIKSNWTYYLDVLDNQNWEGPISQGAISRSDTLWFDPARFLIDTQESFYLESLSTGDAAFIILDTQASIFTDIGIGFQVTFLENLGYRLLDLNEDLSPTKEAASEFDRGIYEDN